MTIPLFTNITGTKQPYLHADHDAVIKITQRDRVRRFLVLCAVSLKMTLSPNHGLSWDQESCDLGLAYSSPYLRMCQGTIWKATLLVSLPLGVVTVT